MLLQLQVWSLYLLQETTVSWDPIHLWTQMGALAKAVVIGLFIMSAYSIGVMIDRVMAYNAARKQSRAFAPAVAGALRKASWKKRSKSPTATRRATWPRL
jgi:biopolymer transport protein ExbB/biopolymer transport protein TolQ